MRFHPATLMLLVWVGAFASFFILPFELTHRKFDTGGFITLIAFLMAFCIGALIKSLPIPQRFPHQQIVLEFSRVDKLLKLVAGIACIVFAIEIIRRGNIDLGAAYLERSDRAQALLNGALSNSSIYFKIGFLTYPASYIFIARQLIYEKKPKLIALFIFGILPGFLAAMAMGGRAPLFNTIVFVILSYILRKRLSEKDKSISQSRFRKVPPPIRVIAIIFAVFALNYFINVFVARASGVGGPEAMLNLVASQWGVTFSGPKADLMVSTLGPATTYLIFVFIWYLVQGIVMSNALFTNYDGEMLWGVYGVDIFSAVMRRVDGAGVAAKFNYLLNLETYGFLPSAFGSLFVDFSYGGILVAAIWGWLASLVYRHIKLGYDLRWRLFAPFITFGILFSLINTPIGYSNGFITHLWMVIAFILIRTSRGYYISQ